MISFGRICTKAILLGILALASPFSFGLVVTPPPGHPGETGLYKAGVMSKADTRLTRVFAEHSAHVTKGAAAPFQPSDRHVQFSRGRVVIDATASSSGEALLNDLKQLGLQHEARSGAVVSGLLPVAAINRAVALNSLRAISASLRPIVHAGAVTSQGDVAMSAHIARATNSVDGTGITVGVLSDSYDVSTLTNIRAADDVASGDLPPGVTVFPEYSLCNILVGCADEGRAMLQIVSDVAPGADLAFHTVMGGVANFANAIAALAAVADVLVDDIIYLNEPMFQDGLVAQAVDTVVGNGKVYYSAVGNQGHDSYESPYVGSGEVLCIEFFFPYDDCDPVTELFGEMHDFDPGPGVDFMQQITVPVGALLSIAFQWDAPFGNVNTGDGPSNDHIIVLLDGTASALIDFSANDNVTTGEPLEVLQYFNDGTYGTTFNVIITFDDLDSPGPPASLMKTVFFGVQSIDDFPTNSSTVFGHANAVGAAAVGAAFYEDTPAFGTSPPVLQPYSSAGDTPILFDTNGDRLVTAELRDKPAFVAPDGVNTTFFYIDNHGNDGIPDFFGTSAAAPHAAGVAALMLQADMAATPFQINAALKNTAIDMGVPGPDDDSGHGLIQADGAITALTGGSTSPTANFSYTDTNLDVVFTDLSSDSDGPIMAWSWDFGDGASSNTQSPYHTYAEGGSYNVALTVTDNDGDTDTATQNLVLNSGSSNTPPIASFTYSCSGKDCTFDASGSTDDGSIANYAWAFGDGNSGMTESPLHTYTSQGNYTVTLVVTDNEAAIGNTSATFRVKKKGNTEGNSDGGSDGTGGTEKGRKKCTDSIDNDGDGLIDGADPDC